MKFGNILFSIIIAGLVSCGGPKYTNPHVLIVTNLGDIEIELYPDKAPKTAGAFLQHLDKGVYKQASFYRVMKMEGVDEISNAGFIQAGIWKTDPVKMTYLPEIPHEPTSQTGLSHTDGILSMASTGAGTAKSEFFICIGDQSPLDAGRRGSADGQGYAAFGKVFKGMDIVRKIQAQSSTGDAFDKKIMIREMKRI